MSPAITLPRLVVVEDHAAVRELVAPRICDSVGMVQAADAGTVEEARIVCLREAPDLVLLDWHLRDGLGSDVLAYAAPRLPQTRWLCVSGIEQPDMVRLAVSLGANGFLLKKWPLDTLCAAVERVLAGDPYFCPDCTRFLVSSMQARGGMDARLTQRERQILSHFARGKSIPDMAVHFGVSQKTVTNVLSLLVEKLRQPERRSLIRYAWDHGLVDASYPPA